MLGFLKFLFQVVVVVVVVCIPLRLLITNCYNQLNKYYDSPVVLYGIIMEEFGLSLEKDKGDTVLVIHFKRSVVC